MLLNVPHLTLPFAGGAGSYSESTVLPSQLCLDLAENGPEMSIVGPWGEVRVLRLENVSLEAPNSENIIISSLSEGQYHELCSWSHFQWFQVSTQHPVGPGIFRSDSQRGTCVTITKPLVFFEKELYWDHAKGAPAELLPNSYDSHRTPKLDLRLSFSPYEMRKAWLAQANCIFAELEEEAGVEDYACPAYWSLDPSGADHLSTEDARILGFPAIHVETSMSGNFWHGSVYKGLRRFHGGKGLDPESPEVARRLGYPLYEVLSDRVPFPAREGYGHRDDFGRNQLADQAQTKHEKWMFGLQSIIDTATILNIERGQSS
ncbi:hypothetical protein C8R45DRAFT_1080092 [Mycena sanguinolenta]|nr:hypothetical protein C8R45DRAFT_1080092 [Mycena sanguinolenta]